ncbi:MAG: hypothetical protein J7J22_03810 [Candidatus Verstraetearchaeota archaeon]|nr:hypothetical protein [Candidatus Verstraetearchaeota archaeon]
MNGSSYDIYVLRIGHRPFRDKRVTTHVALVARAFGAKGIFIDFKDNAVASSIRRVCKLWGGEFKVEFVEDPYAFAKNWKLNKGEIIHLTMYGLNLPSVIEALKSSPKDKLVIIGSEKVPSKYYKISDWNIAIGNQPHSEVAALAILLYELKDKWIYTGIFKNAMMKIIPCRKGKKIVRLN